MSKGEQKNIVEEVFGVFDCFTTANLPRNTYAYRAAGEENECSGSAKKGAYTELLHSLYRGIYPVGDETATLEEYLNPLTIGRQMEPGRDLLQWEYRDRDGADKTLYVMCIGRVDRVCTRLFLASRGREDRPVPPPFWDDMRAAVNTLTKLVPNNRDWARNRECLREKSYVGRRVLVVEDNAFSRKATKEFLMLTGAEVDTVVNGQEAVSRVAYTADGYYDLILMDIRMPVMNGYDAATAIRSLDQKNISRIPIVATTADATVEESPMKKAGMDGYLTKPFQPEQLMEMLGKFLA